MTGTQNGAQEIVALYETILARKTADPADSCQRGRRFCAPISFHKAQRFPARRFGFRSSPTPFRNIPLHIPTYISSRISFRHASGGCRAHGNAGIGQHFLGLGDGMGAEVKNRCRKHRAGMSVLHTGHQIIQRADTA